MSWGLEGVHVKMSETQVSTHIDIASGQGETTDRERDRKREGGKEK